MKTFGKLLTKFNLFAKPRNDKNLEMIWKNLECDPPGRVGNLEWKNVTIPTWYRLGKLKEIVFKIKGYW